MKITGVLITPHMQSIIKLDAIETTQRVAELEEELENTKQIAEFLKASKECDHSNAKFDKDRCVVCPDCRYTWMSWEID